MNYNELYIRVTPDDNYESIIGKLLDAADGHLEEYKKRVESASLKLSKAEDDYKAALNHYNKWLLEHTRVTLANNAQREFFDSVHETREEPPQRIVYGHLYEDAEEDASEPQGAAQKPFNEIITLRVKYSPNHEVLLYEVSSALDYICSNYYDEVDAKYIILTEGEKKNTELWTVYPCMEYMVHVGFNDKIDVNDFIDRFYELFYQVQKVVMTDNE